MVIKTLLLNHFLYVMKMAVDLKCILVQQRCKTALECGENEFSLLDYSVKDTTSNLWK